MIVRQADCDDTVNESHEIIHYYQGCTVYANDYINLQAVQQMKNNAEDVKIQEDVYDLMIESLTILEYVTESYVIEEAVFDFPSKESTRSTRNRHRLDCWDRLQDPPVHSWLPPLSAHQPVTEYVVGRWLVG
jgi:hypothetical protein